LISQKAQPNNGMHPTADTRVLKFSKGAARRVMPALAVFGCRESKGVRFMSQALLVLLYLLAAALLLPLIGALGFRLRGADSIALPGLGVIIATPLLVAALAVAEVGAVCCAAYCVGYLPAARMLFGDGD
jgi:hypothetical protein